MDALRVINQLTQKNRTQLLATIIFAITTLFLGNFDFTWIKSLHHKPKKNLSRSVLLEEIQAYKTRYKESILDNPLQTKSTYLDPSSQPKITPIIYLP